MATHSDLFALEDRIIDGLVAVQEVKAALLSEIESEGTGHGNFRNSDCYSAIAFHLAVLQKHVAACLKELNSEARP
jgi:hypothetical protein